MVGKVQCQADSNRIELEIQFSGYQGIKLQIMELLQVILLLFQLEVTHRLLEVMVYKYSQLLKI
jgi:hypothetical protein